MYDYDGRRIGRFGKGAGMYAFYFCYAADNLHANESNASEITFWYGESRLLTRDGGDFESQLSLRASSGAARRLMCHTL